MNGKYERKVFMEFCEFQRILLIIDACTYSVYQALSALGGGAWGRGYCLTVLGISFPDLCFSSGLKNHTICTA